MRRAGRKVPAPPEDRAASRGTHPAEVNGKVRWTQTLRKARSGLCGGSSSRAGHPLANLRAIG